MRHRIHKSYHRGKGPHGKNYIWHGPMRYDRYLLASRYVRSNW